MHLTKMFRHLPNRLLPPESNSTPRCALFGLLYNPNGVTVTEVGYPNQRHSREAEARGPMIGQKASKLKRGPKRIRRERADDELNTRRTFQCLVEILINVTSCIMSAKFTCNRVERTCGYPRVLGYLKTQTPSGVNHSPCDRLQWRV